jgi:hypothetical protein
MDQLPRRLNLLDASFIVIGIVIGSGIFLLPNLIARQLPSGPVIIAVWVVSGILSFFGALAYAELGAMLPATGGQYVYLREAYGPLCAFVCGWVFVVAIALVESRFSRRILDLPCSFCAAIADGAHSGVLDAGHGAVRHQLHRSPRVSLDSTYLHVGQDRWPGAGHRRRVPCPHTTHTGPLLPPAFSTAGSGLP